MTKALETSKIIIFGNDDVCDLLDENINIRRSFPQLLSIRDLDELIERALSKEALERSKSAIGWAKDVSQIFVPTKSYYKTWESLKNHHFAVLHGPPEMGKTTIAWMIALVKLAEGWEALTCDSPKDFFQLYKQGNHQLFIADDAFGRTEYDPKRGKEWEQQLERMIHNLDGKHWLIWTSRKHILERANKTMDLQGNVEDFPKPSDVLIDSSNLTIQEKALILYRHSKAMQLDVQSKDFIKKYAKLIVNDHDFTPERIRRFVKEVLNDLVTKYNNKELRHIQVGNEIKKAINTPTKRMTKTFKALEEYHVYLLMSLLEAGDHTTREQLMQLYNNHTIQTNHTAEFDAALEELQECFVKVKKGYKFRGSNYNMDASKLSRFNY